MRVYIDSYGNIVKVLDNIFVANSTTVNNTMTWYFVDANGDVVENTDVSYCSVSMMRSDGHLISRINAPLTTTTEGKGYKYTCTQYDGILQVAGALQITAQFVKATIEDEEITAREVLCTTVVEGHVKVNYGIADEEYFNDVLEQAYLDRDTLQAEITDLQTQAEGFAESAVTAAFDGLATVASTGSYNDLTDKPTIPTVNNATLTIKQGTTTLGTFSANASTDKTITIEAEQPNNGTLTIQKNGSTVATFGADSSSNVTANITVPTSASDVNALPSSTKYAKSFDLSINNSTYVMTLVLKDQDGTTLTTDSIDLPLETMVVSGEYNSTTKKVVLTLQGGSTVEFSIADLISGLQSEITSSNKLSADLVSDTSTTNKFVTASDKTTWNAKQDTITAGTGLSKSGATLNHSNSVTAATKGSTTAIPEITYDAQGHITGVTEKTVYPPTSAGTSGQYWKSDGSAAGTWTTPSSSPSSGSSTLISSGAVYTALQSYLTTTSASSTYQTKISSSNKVSADNVDDTSTTNKFVTSAEKSQIALIGDSNTSGTIIYRLDAVESDIATASAILDNL